VGTVLHSVRWVVVGGALAAAWAVCGAARAGEPAALNPFGAVRQDRDDSVVGYLEMSDGQIFVGNVYMTRDKRLKMEDSMRQVGGGDGAPDDNSEKRQREIPLRAVKQIEAKVEKEWVEKEWRFKELAVDEKYFTGRNYPVRKYVYTVTLKDDRKITAPVAEIFYVKPFRELGSGARTDEETEPIRFQIHKRDKGEAGTTLKALTYVKLIKLGERAAEEGKKKATGKVAAKGGKKAAEEDEAAADSMSSDDEKPSKRAAKPKGEDDEDRPAPAKKKASKKTKKQADE
jgi:hypothetical protein